MTTTDLDELFLSVSYLYEYSNIVVSYFSYESAGKTKFRVYFKDLNTGYIHNPTKIERDSTGKTVKVEYIGNFDTLQEALGWCCNEANNYINSNSKS